MNNVRSSQPCFPMKFFTEFNKAQVSSMWVSLKIECKADKCTINRNNNKNNNKSKDLITKAFKEFLLSETLLSVIWLKYFLFRYWFSTVRYCFLYKIFRILEQSTNTLKLKVSKSFFPLLSNLKKKKYRAI